MRKLLYEFFLCFLYIIRHVKSTIFSYYEKKLIRFNKFYIVIDIKCVKNLFYSGIAKDAIHLMKSNFTNKTTSSFKGCSTTSYNLYGSFFDEHNVVPQKEGLETRKYIEIKRYKTL